MSSDEDNNTSKKKQQFTVTSLASRVEDGALDLSVSAIVKVPARELAAVKKLTKLDLSSNKIVVLPDAFCNLVNLVSLELGQNQLESLPSDFGNLRNLRRLDLFKNKLKALPLSFGDLSELRWLDLKSNPLERVPDTVTGPMSTDKDCKNGALQVVAFMKALSEAMEEEVRLRQEAKNAEREMKLRMEKEAADMVRRDYAERKKQARAAATGSRDGRTTKGAAVSKTAEAPQEVHSVPLVFKATLIVAVVAVALGVIVLRLGLESEIAEKLDFLSNAISGQRRFAQ